MTQMVQIVIPANSQDDPRFGSALDYDQQIGQLIGANLVNINGETIRFPGNWIKPIYNGSKH